MSLLLYNLLLPLALVAMLPGALRKNRLRGGAWRDLWQRLGWFSPSQHRALASLSHYDHRYWFHAVSVGEVGVAIKLLEQLLGSDPQAAVVLTTTTPTAQRIAQAFAARQAGRVAVLFSPLDVPPVIARLLDLAAPRQLVLVEAEVWPNWVRAAKKRGLSVSLVNARLSERSERRFAKLAFLTRPLFSQLDRVLVQEPEDVTRWVRLGVNPRHIHVTGSVKYDPEGHTPPDAQIHRLAALLPALGLHLGTEGEGSTQEAARPRVLLAASTHAGEEVALARVWIELRQACGSRPIAFWIVPRHVERTREIASDLRALGLRPVLRSSLADSTASTPFDPDAPFIIDTTGELSAWQHLCDYVVMGKSFLAEGGQNPAEAALARKPVIFGPNMQNFEPLVRLLVASGGAIQVPSLERLAKTLEPLVSDPTLAMRLGQAGYAALARHSGATRRSIEHLLAIRP